MALILGILAGCILAIYSLYFGRIITGSPRAFEEELLKAFAAWAITRGTAIRSQIRLLILASVALELVYFAMVFTTISNSAMLIFTGFLVGVEIVHFSLAIRTFYQFFRGEIMIKEIFNWRMERISAILFFTHCLLVIFSLIWG
jgi:hypothetical protein